MVQNSQLANKPIPSIDRSAELRNYFLPLPAHNVFVFVLLTTCVVTLTIPLIMVNAPPNTNIIIIAISGFVLFLPLCIIFIRLVLYYLRTRPTDQEYDMWVRNHESRLYQTGFEQLHLDPSELIEEPQCIPGIV